MDLNVFCSITLALSIATLIFAILVGIKSYRSIATAVHIEVMNRLGIVFSSEEENETEHKRWNAYMRAEGYVYHPSQKDHIAKTHLNLKPYHELTLKTRQNELYVI